MPIMIEINNHGVPQFPKGDARRLFVLAAAIECLERPTLTSLSQFTGHNKGTIDADVQRLTTQYGLTVTKVGPVYSLSSWGDLLKSHGVRQIIKTKKQLS